MKITRKQLRILLQEMIDPRYEMIPLDQGIFLHGTSTYFGLKPGDILLPPKQTGRQTDRHLHRK